MKCIYGIDPSGDVTPVMVRDAILRCFFEAHKKILSDMKNYGKLSKKELESLEKMDVELQIKSIFTSIQGDFDNPQKQDLINVCEELAKFATHFRQEKTINKHKADIMQLISLLE